MDISSKIAIARSLKDEGNRLAKEKDYRNAVRKYTKIFAYIRGLNPNAVPITGLMGEHKSGGPDEDESTEIKQLELSANLNIALMWLRLEEYTKCIDFCEKAAFFGGLKLIFARFRL